MTIETTNSTISYTGNNSVTVFAYNFLSYSAEHLFIYLDDEVQTTGFSITGIGEDAGGNVTFDVAPSSGVDVRIDRTVPETQLIEYQEYGPFPAKTNERGLDLSVMGNQQIARDVIRNSSKKMDKQPLATENNIVVFDSEGNSLDSGFNITDIDGFTPVEQARQAGDNAQTQFDTPSDVSASPFEFQVRLDGLRMRGQTDYTTNTIGKIDFIVAPGNLSEIDITWYKPLLGVDGVSLINDLSQAYEFPTVAAYKAFATEFPVGKVINTIEFSTGNGGGATYVVISGTGSANTFSVISSDIVSQSIDIDVTSIMNVAQFNALGDGTNDTDALQFACNSGAKDMHLVPNKTYAVSQHNTGFDWYGFFINTSNTTLHGNGSEIYRIEADISTDAKSYSPLMIGTPGSDVAAATENVTITGVDFRGLNTQHTLQGNTPDDVRYAIECKNTRGTDIVKNVFNQIDSRAVSFQQPYTKDLKTGDFFNETKNYDAKIRGNTFNAEPHAVVDRALIRAVLLTGVDGVVVNEQNKFNWTDDGVNASTKYEERNNTENDTWIPTGWLGNPLKRCGRDHKVTDNTFLNNSEHCCYMSSMDVVVTDNTIINEEPDICLSNIKIRAKGFTVHSNKLSNVGSAVEVTEPAYGGTVSENNVEMYDRGLTGGLFSLNVQGIVAFVDNREWLTKRLTCHSIKFINNTATFPNTARTNDKSQIMVKIVTDSSTLPEYPEKNDIELLTIDGNTGKGAENCVFFQNGNIRGATVDNNTFFGKDFTRAGFSAASANSDSVITINGSGATSVLLEVSFKGNTVQGFRQLFGKDPAYATASSRIPPIISGNTLSYIEEFSDAVYRIPSSNNMVEGNYGTFMLDPIRWKDDYMSFNSLSNGAGSDSGKNSRFQKVGATIRVYTDDAGTFETITLT